MVERYALGLLEVGSGGLTRGVTAGAGSISRACAPTSNNIATAAATSNVLMFVVLAFNSSPPWF
jgi:hypothetical protein